MSAFQAHAATTLTPAIKKHLYGYKFYRRRDALPLLADLLIHYWRQLAEDPSSVEYSGSIHPERVLVLPIPPHNGRNNLVAPLAARFARSFDYDCRPRALRWAREVQPQHTLLNHRERLRNIARSLEAERECLTGYRRIIIVDDLTTTGATLREAVRAVRMADGHDGLAADVVTLAVSAITRGEQG